jgi:hypothetical protein
MIDFGGLSISQLGSNEVQRTGRALDLLVPLDYFVVVANKRDSEDNKSNSIQ